MRTSNERIASGDPQDAITPKPESQRSGGVIRRVIGTIMKWFPWTSKKTEQQETPKKHKKKKGLLETRFSELDASTQDLADTATMIRSMTQRSVMVDAARIFDEIAPHPDEEGDDNGTKLE